MTSCGVPADAVFSEHLARVATPRSGSVAPGTDVEAGHQFISGIAGGVGGGNIGANWAIDFLKSGIDVMLVDSDASKEESVRAHLEEQKRLMLGDDEGHEAPWGSLHFGSCIDELRDVQVVTECVPEVLELKQQTISRLDAHLEPEIPIFSSCSGTFRMPELVKDAAKAPQRILVAHPFHPVHLCPLVSVVASPGASKELVAWAVQFHRSIGKYAMETQDNTGYVANRLQEALWREAIHMLDKGMATPEQLDAAVVYGFGLRYCVQGPLMTYHLSAHDGMEGFLRHFGVTQDAPYSFLDSPSFTPELKQKLVDGCERMAQGRSVAQLSAVRDAGLVAVGRALEKTPRVVTFMEPERFQQRVGDTKLHVVTAGSGPPVLCLPGALGTAETDFGPQIEALSKHYTVVCFDPRGYGQSREVEGRTFPVDFYARDARDGAYLMAGLGHEQYAVLGWSDGANSGVHLAAMHPERVTKLAIWGANTHYDQEDIEAFEATRNVAESWSPRMRDALEAVYGAEELQRIWSEACDAWQQIEQRGGNVCGEEARSVACPTLILHGAKDPMVLQSHPEALHRAIPGSQLHILPEGKHNLHLRYADEVNALLLRFLRGEGE